MPKQETPIAQRKLEAFRRSAPAARGERLLRLEQAVEINYIPPEIEATLADAVQANYRKYKPHRALPTCNILNDWFSPSDFRSR